MLRRLLGLFTSDPQPAQVATPASAPNPEAVARQAKMKEAGSVDGQYLTDYVETVKQLKEDKQYDEAEALLLKLIDATEREAAASDGEKGAAPWYYEQLAMIYRRQMRYADEVALLERFVAQPKSLGRGPARLADRLEKARGMLEKHSK